MPWTVDWKVFIDGDDLTSDMEPYLMKVSVSDKDGQASDSCSLEFDDAGGQLKMPTEGSEVRVFLDGVSVFTGIVDAVRSRGARGSGRTLSVNSKGFDTKGKAKDPQSHHMDDATLQQFLEKSAKTAGLAGVQVDPAFANINRNYWSASGESFLHIGQKIAREVGGIFKIRGDQAVLAKRGSGTSAGGQSMPAIVGVAPPPGTSTGNVVNWDISPLTGRGKFKKTKARYFDRASASYKEIEVETDVEADATDEVRTTVADEDQAKGIAEGRKGESQRDSGSGSVTLDLEPTAQAGGTYVMVGARPGVDGNYVISGATHNADRGGGATTALEIKQPTGAAGKDYRKAGEGKSGSPTSQAANEAEGSGGSGVGGSGASGSSGTENYREYNRRYGTTDEN